MALIELKIACVVNLQVSDWNSGAVEYVERTPSKPDAVAFRAATKRMKYSWMLVFDQGSSGEAVTDSWNCESPCTSVTFPSGFIGRSLSSVSVRSTTLATPESRCSDILPIQVAYRAEQREKGDGCKKARKDASPGASYEAVRFGGDGVHICTRL